MNEIKVKFLGLPSIYINNKKMDLPYIKAEGVLYLLLYERTASRDLLSTLLWGDMEDEQAKKNLRNAVYIIRKHLVDDIIISPKRSLLQLNEKYSIRSDIDFLKDFIPKASLSSEEIKNFIDLYDGEFLNELKLRSNPEFIEWADNIGRKIHLGYINKLRLLSRDLIENREYDLGEACSLKLIELEEYEEEGYTNLMEIFQHKNMHQAAIDTYNRLVEKLNNDLSVKPSKETDRIYKEIIKDIRIRKTTKQLGFLGRREEREKIYTNIYNFIGGKPFNSILISGEEGIGKSLLLEKIVKDFDLNALLIRINCHEYESSFIFKFWDKVFNQISEIIRERNFKIPKELADNIVKTFPTLDIYDKEYFQVHSYESNYDLTEKAIFELFTFLSKKLKIIFVVDDLNYADSGSLELLYKTILANRYNIMLIASDKDMDKKRDDKFYHLLKYNNILEKIPLNRFTLEETKILVERNTPEAINQIEQIYKESEGNPLFIVEIINNIKNNNFSGYMTDKIENLIKKRLYNLSAEATKLLSICSLFHDKFYIDSLTTITDMTSLELIDTIDELLTKDILREDIGGEQGLGFYFTHKKISEYIYKTMSHSKRMILHGKLAEYYEAELLNNKNINRTLYPELIYHLRYSYSYCKLFKYKTRWLEEILNVNHEIFPIVESGRSVNLGLLEFYLDEKTLEKELREISEIHDNAMCKKCKECIEEEIIYLYISGRFNKNRGSFEEGLNYLKEMVRISEEHKYFEYAYKAYLQLSHCYLNIGDLGNMKKVIYKAEDMARTLEDKGKEAIVWRLKGYLYILLGDFSEGEMYIRDALEIFDCVGNKERYLLNIVASLFYLGESYRIQEHYDRALGYYNKALDLCLDNEEHPAAALIFSKIGFIKYRYKQIDEAQFYYLKSLKAYEKNIFAWGRLEVYYYLSKIYMIKNKPGKVKYYLEESLNFIDRYPSKEMREEIYSMLREIN